MSHLYLYHASMLFPRFDMRFFKPQNQCAFLLPSLTIYKKKINYIQSKYIQQYIQQQDKFWYECYITKMKYIDKKEQKELPKKSPSTMACNPPSSLGDGGRMGLKILEKSLLGVGGPKFLFWCGGLYCCGVNFVGRIT